MAVTINSGAIEAEDLLRHVPTDKWRELMLARRRFLEIKLSHDCRCLVQFVNDAKLMFTELGFNSPEAMIRDGYGLEPSEIAVAVRWLELNPPADPISLKQVRKLAWHGGDRRSEQAQEVQGDIITLKARGTSRAYILARLDRDGHIELAAQVRDKKMSAKAAAEQVGYRKPPSSLKQLRKAWAKATPDERTAFLAEISTKKERAA